MFLTIGFIIVALIIGILFGYHYTKKNIKCDQSDMLDQYMTHRENMKVVRAVNKSEDNPGKDSVTHKNPAKDTDMDVDRDIGVLNHHMGSRGVDPYASKFAHWKDDVESQNKIYWD